MTLDRRRFLAASARLGLGAVAAGTLAGCSFHDPRISGGPTALPSVPPVTPIPPFTGAGTALPREVNLAAAARALTEKATAMKVPANVATQAGHAARAFDAHVMALSGPRPVERPTAPATPSKTWSPKPAPTPTVSLPGDAKGAVAALQGQANDAAAAYRGLASAAQGSSALFWASLRGYAQGIAQVVGTDAARPEPPQQEVRPLEVWSDSEGPQQVVSQLHALIYGYQAALAPLRGPDSATVTGLLQQYRALRDDLSIKLRDRGFAVPPAEAAYVLPQQPASKEMSFALLAQMEQAFQPFAGGWVASATEQETRERAMGVLESSIKNCLQFGGPLVAWPGWPA